MKLLKRVLQIIFVIMICFEFLEIMCIYMLFLPWFLKQFNCSEAVHSNSLINWIWLFGVSLFLSFSDLDILDRKTERQSSPRGCKQSIGCKIKWVKNWLAIFQKHPIDFFINCNILYSKLNCCYFLFNGSDKLSIVWCRNIK